MSSADLASIPDRIPETPLGVFDNVGAAWLGDISMPATQWEHVPDLQWPMSSTTYFRMRTDPAVEAILRLIKRPIQRASWRLETEGIDPAVVRTVERAIGMTEGTPSPTRVEGLRFRRVVGQLLQALDYGFVALNYWFVRSEKDGKWIFGGLDDRHPRTLLDLTVDTSGDFKAARQFAYTANGSRTPGLIEIPADRLVFWAHEQEGSDWYGRSVLRAAYRPWRTKEHVEKWTAQTAERQMMGIPTVTFGEGLSEGKALAIASGVRTGARTGVAIPFGSEFAMKGVDGSTFDPIPLLRWLDEQMALSVLAPFLTLGHDTGARSLGETFLEVFEQTIGSWVDDVADVINHQLIRRAVDANHPVGTPAPWVVCDPIQYGTGAFATAVADLTGAKALVADDALNAHLRRRMSIAVGDTVEQAAKREAETAVASRPVPAATDANKPPAGRKPSNTNR